MDLVPHFWRVFGLGRFTVRLEFHEAVDARGFASRKTLAQHCITHFKHTDSIAIRVFSTI